MQKDPSYYIQGVLDNNRLMLARTITLVESILSTHQEIAKHVINELLPYTGKAVRLGITGVPGAGKSTFIESFGTMLTTMGHRVATLPWLKRRVSQMSPPVNLPGISPQLLANWWKHWHQCRRY